MIFLSKHSILLLIVYLFILPINSQADNSKLYDRHTVHFNAFPSDSLPSQMTQKYKIQRSKNIALINVSIVKNDKSKKIEGIQSRVTGVLKNLLGQLKKLDFQEVHEGSAYYYIAQVAVENNDIVHFKVQIETHDKQHYDIKFRKQFRTK